MKTKKRAGISQRALRAHRKAQRERQAERLREHARRQVERNDQWQARLLDAVRAGREINRKEAIIACRLGLIENTGWWSGWKVRTATERMVDAAMRNGGGDKFDLINRFVQMYNGPLKWTSAYGEIPNGPLPYSGTTWVGTAGDKLDEMLKKKEPNE